jgi:hypothetical protein
MSTAKIFFFSNGANSGAAPRSTFARARTEAIVRSFELP